MLQKTISANQASTNILQLIEEAIHLTSMQNIRESIIVWY